MVTRTPLNIRSSAYCLSTFCRAKSTTLAQAALLLRYLLRTRLDARAHTSKQGRTPSVQVISPSQRPLPKRHMQRTNIHGHQRDSNPRPQQMNGRRPTTKTPRPPGSASDSTPCPKKIVPFFYLFIFF